jgi:Spy/CpxP family protein refolding chaperone
LKLIQNTTAKKKAAVGAVAILSVLTLVGMTLKSRSTAAADRESLKLQRAALGMPDPEKMRANMLDGMARELGLTEAQKGQMKAAMEERTNIRAIFEDKSLTREQRRERAGKARQESEARIEAGLTPEQKVKYQQMQAQRREQFRGRRGFGSPGSMPGGTAGFGTPPNGTR